MSEQVRVEIIPRSEGGGHMARINGVEVPIVTYGVEPQEQDGTTLVSLLIPADSVQIGEPQVHVAEPEKTVRSSWGAPGTLDPRESIPGWQSEALGEQVARNAEATA